MTRVLFCSKPDCLWDPGVLRDLGSGDCTSQKHLGCILTPSHVAGASWSLRKPSTSDRGWLLPYIRWVLRLICRLSSEDLPCPALQTQRTRSQVRPSLLFLFKCLALAWVPFLVSALSFSLKARWLWGDQFCHHFLSYCQSESAQNLSRSRESFHSTKLLSTPLLREVRGCARISVQE